MRSTFWSEIDSEFANHVASSQQPAWSILQYSAPRRTLWLHVQNQENNQLAELFFHDKRLAWLLITLLLSNFVSSTDYDIFTVKHHNCHNMLHVCSYHIATREIWNWEVSPQQNHHCLKSWMYFLSICCFARTSVWYCRILLRCAALQLAGPRRRSSVLCQHP